MDYHDNSGHMGIEKIHDIIKHKYYGHNMYKELYDYINNCITCQTRNLTKVKPPQQETDAPPYPFAKIGLDVAGPYHRTLSGNKYRVGFVDWYSGWAETFPVPDKSAETIAHLLLEEIIPRHSTPLQLVTDNGAEHVNKVMQHFLQTLNISHITICYYHPQSNSEVERFHRSFNDVMSKKVKEHLDTWDLYINQVLVAIRFNTNEPTKFSPFYLLYNREPVMQIDNILNPRQKYMVLVHRHLKRAKKRQAKYADRNSKHTDFQVGDPVYVKQQQQKSKLQGRWQPYYRIIEKTTPVSFRIKNQLDGTLTKVHTEHLRLANIDEWDIPKDQRGRPIRKAKYAVPPSSSSSEDESDHSNEPLAKIAKKY